VSQTRSLASALTRLRCAPLLLGYALARDRSVIAADLEHWVRITRVSRRGALLTLLSGSERQFRNLFYHRLRRAGRWSRRIEPLLRSIYIGERTLFLTTGDIGPGLFIQHGFATIVSAKSVGANCWINQQVTIGYRRGAWDAPVLRDGVMVGAGAKILGDVTIGQGARVGANAVVITDVPDWATAVGVPASIVHSAQPK
jgi:serine O-acetyltransferase